VVDALRRIHDALIPGGLLIDTQPISARPAVTTGASHLGTIDMREWAELIAAVDAQITRSVDDGLWTVRGEQHFVVADSFDAGTELVTTVNGWQGARVPADLELKLADEGPAEVHQQVRMRLLVAT
jgi:hypothetical protein